MDGFKYNTPATESDLTSAVVRGNFNAIGSLNSGTVAPPEPWEGMPWIDTSDIANIKEKRYINGAWRTLHVHLEGTGPSTSGARIVNFSVKVPAERWILRHELGTPLTAVQLMNSAHETVYADVTRVDADVVVATFKNKQTGYAVVIGGDEMSTEGKGACTPKASGETDSMSMPRGCLTIIEKDVATKQVVRIEEADNLIVFGARESMAHCCAGNDTENWAISNMGFGTGGHAPADPDTPIPPEITDVALETQVIVKTVVAAFPSQDSVIFEATLESDEAVGSDITEAGLLCGNNTLFARKTFKAFHKSAGRTITYRWQIFFELSENAGCCGSSSPSSCGSVQPFSTFRFKSTAGGETEITVNGFEIVPGQSRLFVYINGRHQAAPYDYTETCTSIQLTPLSFPAGLAADDVVDFVWINPGVC